MTQEDTKTILKSTHLQLIIPNNMDLKYVRYYLKNFMYINFLNSCGTHKAYTTFCCCHFTDDETES